ncbi:MAG: hypothetical protein EA397_17105 [Deltaproteobacteria bacterium]|nr:MAG: hypothetical protein EA397_17105 [Deltaproteobacteria bacterium]
MASTEGESSMEALAGCKEQTLRERTGRGWQAWVDRLDEAGAGELDHADIVALIDPSIDRWWAQTITVGYERIKGRRAVGQSAEGTFNTSKSATLPAGVERVRAAFSQEQRSRWLPVDLQERSTTSSSSLRFDLPDGTRASLWFTQKGPEKCSVSVQIERLPDAHARDVAKEAWGRYLSALKKELTRG